MFRFCFSILDHSDAFWSLVVDLSWWSLAFASIVTRWRCLCARESHYLSTNHLHVSFLFQHAWPLWCVLIFCCWFVMMITSICVDSHEVTMLVRKGISLSEHKSFACFPLYWRKFSVQTYSPVVDLSWWSLAIVIWQWWFNYHWGTARDG